MKECLNPPSTGQRGQTILLVAISLIMILAMAALAIDVVTLYSARSEAQRTADAAALAGAKILADSGMTSDPCNTILPPNAQTWATQTATAVAQQNPISGVAPAIVTVTYPNGSQIGCTGAFVINPQISVQVQRTDLPTFFARIWSRRTATVTATAVAEAYNPSNAAQVGTPAPLALRCVKPMLLPNCDPGHTTGASSNCSIASSTFVDPTTGAITNPGQFPSGVIGEQFASPSPGPMTSDCGVNSPRLCPIAPPPTPGKYYVLATPPNGFHLCPGTSSTCSSAPPGFQQDLQCCSAAPIQCGQQYTIDTGVISPDGMGGAAQLGGQCLIHEPTGTPKANCSTNSPQDCLDTTVTPFRVLAGTSNPYLGTSVKAGDQVTTSDSIVTVPLFDPPPGGGGPPPTITVIGFLQLFINDVDDMGNITATILNVAGCDRTASGTPVQGASNTLPVRLIHQ